MLRHQIGNDFRIAGRVKNIAFKLKRLAKGSSVDQIAVVAKGQLPLHMLDDKGLGIDLRGFPRCGVAHVPDGDFPLGQTF